MVMVMMMKMVKVSGRRRRIGGGGMAERKLEEIPDLRFGVRLGVSYEHDLSLSLSPVWETTTSFGVSFLFYL